LASHSSKSKETSLPVYAIGSLLTSKNTWEVATGTASVGAFFFLMEFLGLLKKRWQSGKAI
ncbi:MAG: hypothetical protein WA579_15720, partial [Rhodomicrobium sp.]